MRDLIRWKDEVVEYPGRYKETTNTDGTVDHVKSPGEIVQPGTPLNAVNLNDMDEAAWEALQTAKFLLNYARQTRDHVDAVEGEVIRVNLTNTQAYPLNSSGKTVALAKKRNKTDYTVLVDVIDSTGGGVGDIRITNRADNAFKISYSGAASAVTVDCYVQGGY